jgi:WD40 repeat protein
VRIWDAETGAAIANPLVGHSTDVTCVAFSPGGRRIASSSYDLTVQVWDADTATAIENPPSRYLAGWTVAFFPDGRHMSLAL